MPGERKPIRMRLLLSLMAIAAVMFSLVSCGGGVGESAQNDGDDTHGGVKVRITEENRTATEHEQKILDRLYISNLDDYGSTYGDEIYHSISITGEAMPEESVYSVKDIEELVRISFLNREMHDTEMFMEIGGFYGLDFMKFMDMSGLDSDTEDLTFDCRDENGDGKILSYNELSEHDTSTLLAVGDGDGPFNINGQEQDGPFMLMVFDESGQKEKIAVKQITAGSGESPEDPGYGYHDRDPYEDSLDCTFSIEIYQEGAEYLGVVDTVEFTTAMLEDIMRSEPSAVRSGYYGTIGNRETSAYSGTGGWIDYFEGIDFLWLLREYAGIENPEGRAELVGRDGEVYNTIDDIGYFNHIGNEESYYVMTGDGVEIPGAVPMIGFIKNGYPILKEHEHDSSAYVAYNELNQALEERGIMTEVGVVKNHNGPFAACFGNLDGYYGGEQQETAGDCVAVRLYLR